MSYVFITNVVHVPYNSINRYLIQPTDKVGARASTAPIDVPNRIYSYSLQSPSQLKKHFYADHFQAPSVGEGAAVVEASHGAFWVVVDELAEEAGGGEVG